MTYIEGNSGKWEYVIGLEVHAQVLSKSKLFSSSSTAFGASVNSQVSFVDAAFPGMLPVLNMQCVHQAIRTGIGIGAKINKYSAFDRKNYFYADLPQGYQISQFYYPIVSDGIIEIDTENGGKKNIRVNRIHLEQDAGKSMHDNSPTYTYIDLNRSGIALMEIVSEPDIVSPFEAGEYLKKIRALLRYLGTCDGDMEKGSLRCDANVSVRRVGEALGTRCEIKNINSIKNVMRAIEYEAMRQVTLIENNGIVYQETRLFDADNGVTRTMRSKEEACDYRYFPDPDLSPVIITQEIIDEIASTMPELPDAKIARYMADMGLSKYDAETLVSDKEVAEYFESAAQKTKPKLLSNWMIGELFAAMNKADITLNKCNISADSLAALVNLIDDNTISGKIAKTVFDEMFTTGRAPEVIVKERGLTQLTNIDEIRAIVKSIISENPDVVLSYKSGKDKLFGFFVGKVMSKTDGKANPSIVNELLKEELQ